MKVVLVGAGIIGTSIAYHLARRRSPDRSVSSITVLERDRIGAATTAAATGGIRQQFSSAVNVDLARESVAIFERFADVVGEPIPFRQHGYLFVTAEPAAMTSLATGVDLQTARGVPARLLEPADVAMLQPGLDIGDIVGGAYCPTDGSAVPADVCAAFARQARRWGATIREHTPVLGIEATADGFAVATPGATIDADIVINAAGPWAGRIGAMVGLEHPVSPHPRQAFAIKRPDWLSPTSPLTVDLDTGAYVHPEQSSAVVGGTDRDRPASELAELDDERFERLLLALMRRFPALEEAEVVASWVGLREMTPDDHALVGPVAEVPGYWVAAGFSGHGFMHAPAVGREVARWITTGSPELDLAPLAPARFGVGAVRDEQYVF